MNNIIFNENQQEFIKIPDGDIPTHAELKKAFDQEMEQRINGIKSNYVPKSSILQLIKMINNDIEYNKKSTPKAKIDPMSGNTVYRQTTIVYAPEVIKKHLEKLL